MAKKLFICEHFKQHEPPCSYALCEDEKIIVGDAEIHECSAHGELDGPSLQAAIKASLLDPPIPD